jgi:hypothetical protein
MQQSGLAAAIGGNQADPVAPLQLKIELVEYQGALGILKGYTFKVYQYIILLHEKCTACHNNIPKKKDGGISVVAKKRYAIGTFF